MSTEAERAEESPTGPQLAAASTTFALLSSPVRLHLAWLAASGARDVGSLAREAGVSVASASQHLTKLRLAGIVIVRTAGRHHIYEVVDPHIVTLLGQIFDHIAPDGTLAPDPR